MLTKKINLFFFSMLMFLSSSNVIAFEISDFQSNLTYLSKTIKKEVNDNILNEKKDTIANNILKVNQIDSNLYYLPSEFMYADNQRYTLTGDLPYRETHIKPLAFSLFTGTYAGFMVGQHVLQMKTIWKDQTDFKIREDGIYALYADKAGHFYGTYLMSYMMNEGFLISGLSKDASAFWGGIMGLSYQTYVEILDGYGKNWGFSPTDFYCDIAGASFFIAQNYVPYLQNFTPKFQYFPPKWHNTRSRIPHEMFIDDYSSHSMWISANLHNILPNEVKEYVPDWLCLSIGYTARNLADVTNADIYGIRPHKGDVIIDGYFGSPRCIIALDYDFVKMLPDGGYFWNWVKQTLNLLKFPSPAIEIGHRTRFYMLYPFAVVF